MANLFKMRKEYSTKGLERIDLEDNPYLQFEKWFNEAIDSKLIEPNAFTLATVGKDLKPSQRSVLLKSYDKKGFVFFSNYNSKKAQNIKENNNISAHFAWLGLERQVRIEGTIEEIPKKDSLKYFLSRPKGSQLGAWVSHQSQIISSRSLLEQKFDEMRKKFSKGEIPFPSFWGGYLIKAEYFEFWQGSKDRLHDRFIYEKKDYRWKISRLEP